MYSDNEEVATIQKDIIMSDSKHDISGIFNISGNFLGKYLVCILISNTGF